MFRDGWEARCNLGAVPFFFCLDGLVIFIPPCILLVVGMFRYAGRRCVDSICFLYNIILNTLHLHSFPAFLLVSLMFGAHSSCEVGGSDDAILGGRPNR